MIAKFAPLPVKALGAKIFEILGKIAPHRNGQPRHITGRASLFAVRQARRIAKGCTAHAECAGFACHAFGKFALGAGQFFGNCCRHIIG